MSKKHIITTVLATLVLLIVVLANIANWWKSNDYSIKISKMDCSSMSNIETIEKYFTLDRKKMREVFDNGEILAFDIDNSASFGFEDWYPTKNYEVTMGTIPSCKNKAFFNVYVKDDKTQLLFAQKLDNLGIAYRIIKR